MFKDLTLCGLALFQMRFSLGRTNFVEESDEVN